ncbi:hypothetical protein [Adlercreutzia sp. ZJ154]|uniref:hypothetical protein n=1 Tax=Adlercreutzia sp. ZJ154 TaxID=2709790 RepID=UPI0013EC3C8D|nr:hypothetical protein [Adlercreutzia sp. ZJ154]
MKKTSKLLGAIGLSAALAIGTAVPAFAATTQWTDAGNNDETTALGSLVEDGTKGEIADGSNSSTKVHIGTNISQLSVQVPIKLYLATESAGGALIAPSAGTYTIKNYTTTADIFVTKVQCDYSTGNAAGKDWLLVEDGALVGAGVAAADATHANLKVDMAAKQPYNASGDKLASSSALGNWTLSADTTNDKNVKDLSAGNGWVIYKAKDASTPCDIEIDFSGQSSVVKAPEGFNSTAGANGNNAFNLTYTISASNA